MGKKKQIRNLELEVKRLRKNVIEHELVIDKLLSDTITDQEKNVIKRDRQFSKATAAELDKYLLLGKNQDSTIVSKTYEFYDSMKRNPNNISNISEDFKQAPIEEISFINKVSADNRDNYVPKSITKKDDVEEGYMLVKVPIGSHIVPPNDNENIKKTDIDTLIMKEAIYFVNRFIGIKNPEKGRSIGNIGKILTKNNDGLWFDINNTKHTYTDDQMISDWKNGYIKAEYIIEGDDKIKLKDVNVWGHNVGDVSFQKSELLDGKQNNQGSGFITNPIEQEFRIKNHKDILTYHEASKKEERINNSQIIKDFLSILKKDTDYLRSWKDNIAMAFQDNYRWAVDAGNIDIHKIANDAATSFLGSLLHKPCDIIDVAERLYYYMNPYSKMDVPSSAFELTEKWHAEWQELDSDPGQSFFDWCIENKTKYKIELIKDKLKKCVSVITKVELDGDPIGTVFKNNKNCFYYNTGGKYRSIPFEDIYRLFIDGKVRIMECEDQECAPAKEEEEERPTHPPLECKTSEKWLAEIPSEYKVKITDPDGWNRSNFEYSFKSECISKEEFIKRLYYSTIKSNIYFWASDWASDWPNK